MLAFLPAFGSVHCLLQFVGCVVNKNSRDFRFPFQNCFLLFRFLQFGKEPVLVFAAVLQFFFESRIFRNECGDLLFVGLFSARLPERFRGGRERCNFARQALAFAFEFLRRSLCVGLSAFCNVGA